MREKEIVSGRKVTRLPELPLACVASVSVRFGSKVRGTRVGDRTKMALVPLFARTDSLATQASSAEILVLAPYGLDELPEVHFEFPFMLIGKSTVAFFTG